MGLFSKTPEQQAEAAWKKNADRKPHECRIAAIREGNMPHFKYLSKIGKCTQLERRETLREIARSNAVEMLQLLIKQNGAGCFDFGDSYSLDAWFTMDVLGIAANHETLECHDLWLATALQNKKVNAHISNGEIDCAYARRGALAMLKKSIKRIGSENLKSHMPDLLIAATMSKSDDVFNYIFDFAKNYEFENASFLTNSLEISVKKKRLERSAKLIQIGAKFTNGMGLSAAENKDKDMLLFLKEQGFDYHKKAFRSDWEVMRQMGSITEDINTFMRDIAGEQKEEKDPTPAKTEEAPLGSAAPSFDAAREMDILTDTAALSSDLSMTTVFNFVSQQQIVIVVNVNPPLMTTTITPFFKIEDARIIEQAEQKLIAENRRSDINRNDFFGKGSK